MSSIPLATIVPVMTTLGTIVKGFRKKEGMPVGLPEPSEGERMSAEFSAVESARLFAAESDV